MKVKEELEKAQLLEFYRQMCLVRTFEEECARQYMQGNIGGFLHLYIGEEAIAVGAISALRSQDYVVTHYRDHGHALARGMDSKVVMAELFGKATGSSGGKGGSMHLFDVALNFMGGYAIVGGQMPVAAGLALATKLKEEDRIVVCFLGDGALNEGEFHESMNLVSIRQLPVIYFCENNQYGMGAPVRETFALSEEIYRVAEAYNMRGVRVDGMDVLEVRRATAEVLEYVSTGKGPVFIEAQTYRFRGHSIADPADYRHNAEVEGWLAKDPIATFKRKLLDEGLATEPELAEIDGLVMKEIEEAVRFAEDSPFPDPSDLYEDVYEATEVPTEEEAKEALERAAGAGRAH